MRFDLWVPIRSQLSAIIFEKAMRRKIVKAAGKSSKDGSADQSGVTTAGPSGESVRGKEGSQKDGGGDDDNEGDDATGQKSRQDVINLIGVDTKRIADFSMIQHMLPSSILRLVISLRFLVFLLGWIPVTIGLISVALTMPINNFFAKFLYAVNKRLMSIRDQKLALINEALQGVRQIKFSALEPQWEKRILSLRQKELAAVWDYFRADSVLYACWTTGPIALTLTSLTSYAWLNGELTASVAFVSIGIFSTLDFAISAMPELIRLGLDAWVSVKRVEKHLNAPELTKVTKNNPDIAFEDASLAWPVDEEQTEGERFILRNVDLAFPRGELSVILGKTGSGKSLLLAAILGEVDLLSGSVYAPDAPTFEDRQDHKANPGNWILPTSVAFVGQIPWIENATIRDNILFGLPFDEGRYEQTLAACALKKDLESLTDGDKTELGVNGINLSGGQKWRVTVARAVYSRAGILILDDIFSAVDAHVGRHILDHCLAGDLCKGRTRILVTHHIALCEQKAKFIVELADGTVIHSGLTSELQEEGVLERIKSHLDVEEEDATAVNSQDRSDVGGQGDDQGGAPLKKVLSKGPKKFVEDETREKGSVKGRIYGIYMRDSGGMFWWSFLAILYLSYEATVLGAFAPLRDSSVAKLTYNF
jgi:ABC-type multidrug transport system fused ATPase/permease subunit